MPIYNLNPAKATASNILDDNSPSNYRKYTGYDVNFNSRMKGLTVFGGVSFGHQNSNTCQVEDANLLRFCDQSKLDIPYYTQIKLSGSYMLPYQLQISGTFQSYPGDARNASPDTLIAAEDPSLRGNWQVTMRRCETLHRHIVTWPHRYMATSSHRYMVSGRRCRRCRHVGKLPPKGTVGFRVEDLRQHFIEE